MCNSTVQVVKDTTLKPLIIAQSTSCMIAAVQCCSVALKVHCGGGNAWPLPRRQSCVAIGEAHTASGQRNLISTTFFAWQNAKAIRCAPSDANLPPLCFLPSRPLFLLCDSRGLHKIGEKPSSMALPYLAFARILSPFFSLNEYLHSTTTSITA